MSSLTQKTLGVTFNTAIMKPQARNDDNNNKIIRHSQCSRSPRSDSPRLWEFLRFRTPATLTFNVQLAFETR